jgi:hypothetical protein
MTTTARITDNPSNEWPQYMALAALSLGAAGATTILYPFHREYFQPIFGSINPLLAVGMVTILGVASLCFLQSRGWFAIYSKQETLQGTLLSATLATMFAIPTILVDRGFGISLELNVPPPWSLLFYPSLGYVAEISFHAIPLALLLALLRPLFKTLNPNRLVWFCILLAAVLEPIFQLSAGLADQSMSWVEAYVGLHVFVFNVAQLYVFRRFDFASMYSFRLAYYFWWHIVWGFVRLQS